MQHFLNAGGAQQPRKPRTETPESPGLAPQSVRNAEQILRPLFPWRPPDAQRPGEAAMRLELEVEYDTEPEDEERHRRYVENGMDSDFAWRRVAQDALGNIGLIVQGAEAFER